MDFEDSESIQEFQEEVFQLTTEGKKFTKNYYDQLSDNQKHIISKFKSKLNTVQLRSILRYVYEKYPGQIEESSIKDKILQ